MSDRLKLDNTTFPGGDVSARLLLERARQAYASGELDKAKDLMEQLKQLPEASPETRVEALLLEGELADPQVAPRFFREGLKLAIEFDLIDLRAECVKRLYGTSM